MKKYLFLLMILASCTVMAQTPVDTTRTRPDVTADDIDTSDTEENVIGGRVQRTNIQKESNVLGAPVYYNPDGSVRDGNHRGNPRGEYIRPKHHYKNTLSNYFNAYFCEAELMVGDKDQAIGLNFTWLPERWGLYGSMLTGFRHNYFSLGPALRISDTEDWCDWHLYGGFMFGDGIGGECGLRIASDKTRSNFGWCSGSMGVAVMDGRGYLTLGLSLDLTAITALGMLLLLY